MSARLAKRLVEPDFWTCPHGKRVRPAKVLTYGPEVAEVCAAAGFAPDSQQQLGLDLIFAINPDGSPASFETCVICSRQNLKTGLLKQTVLGWTFVLDEPDIVWSSHEMGTTREAQDELAELIRSTPSLARHMMPTKNEGVYTENGEERIELADGRKIWFRARTLTGGRGLARRKLILDEAFALRKRMMGSLIPIMLAKQHAQVIYASSPGHSDSEVLFDVRDRGRAGTTPRMNYLEWSGKPLPPCKDEHCKHPKTGLKRGDPCALNRLELVLHANPTVTTGRITVQDLDDTRYALPPEEWVRECMGQWDEPEEPEEADVKLDLDAWQDMLGLTDEPLEPLAFGVTIAPNRKHAWIGVAGQRPDGLMQVELVAERRGSRWPVDWLAERIPKWNPVAVVLDGTALSLKLPLEDLGFEVKTTTSTDRTQATVGFFDLFEAAKLRHPGERLLDEAAEAAVKKPMMNGFVWDGPQAVGPLVAVTLAAYGVTGTPAPKDPPPTPRLVRKTTTPSARGRRSRDKDLTTAGF